MPLDDYSALIASGMSLVPDPLQQKAREQTVKANALQLEHAATQIQREAHFQTDLQAMLSAPTAGNVSALMMKYPEYSEQLKRGWDVKDKAARDGDFTTLSEIWSAIDNGHPELAAKVARRRYDADVAAGVADQGDQAIVDDLESGDPVRINQAKGMIGIHVSALAGPEHFGSVAGAMKKGVHEVDGIIYDDNGQPIAQSPYAKIIPGPDGSFYTQPRIGTIPVLGGTGGRSESGAVQPPASSAPIPTGGGIDPMKLWNEFIAPHEGGYSPRDGNGKPVNFGINQGANPDVNVKDLTQEQAGKLFVDRYFKQSGADKLPPGLAAVHADTFFINPGMADRFLKASGGDPDKYMTMRENWLDGLAKKPKYKRFEHAWSTRNSELRDYAMKVGGDDYYSQPGAAAIKVTSKAQYDELPSGTPFEAPDGTVRVKP